MTRARCVIGIDQGTTATKACRLFEDGRSEPLFSRTHRQFHPAPGQVEHDPLELLGAVEAALAADDGAVAFGLDNQGETVVAWDAWTGRPLHNAIVWSDARTQPAIDALRAAGGEALTRARAGLPLDPYFSASKLRWLLDHAEGAPTLLREGRLRLGTSDSFFLDRLCGQYVTDVTTASRTSLMNLARQCWDPDLCALFGVPMETLPRIVPTVTEVGSTRAGLRCVASIVDQQAALFAHGCRRPGQAKITFGTGAFALMVTGAVPDLSGADGMLPTLAWQVSGCAPVFALEGGVYNAGSAVDWLRTLGLFQHFDEIDHYEGPSALERGLVFVPALSGLACPYWDRSAAGLWLGLDLSTSRADLCRAVLEGVALRAAQVLRAMGAHAALTGAISVDGGLIHNRYFCAFLAAALGRDVLVQRSADLTALGAAALAAVGVGLMAADTVIDPGTARLIEPDLPFTPALRERFDSAVARSRGWRADA